MASDTRTALQRLLRDTSKPEEQILQLIELAGANAKHSSPTTSPPSTT
ncbi:MAG: hypothetical protein U5Q44_13145 [Dehalococcoidia bacterium]|nr:hypothetical protein [Dehalococcoidia bacterium]